MDKIKVKVRNTLTMRSEIVLSGDQVEGLVEAYYRSKMNLSQEDRVSVEFNVTRGELFDGVTISHESTAVEDLERTL